MSAERLEKRKEHRIRVALPIRIGFGEDRYTGQTDNISRLGAYAELERELAVGSEIEITLEIPRYTKDPSLIQAVRCKGNVFRSALIRQEGASRHYGAGIFFTGFESEADRERLSRYIDFLISQEEESVNEGLKAWREKRQTHRKKEPQEIEERADGKDETLALLREILERLEEIGRLLKDRSRG